MTGQPDMLKLLLEAGANINDNIPIYHATSFFIRGTASIPVPFADSTTANINFKTGTISIDSGERDLSIKVDITQVTFTLMNLAVLSVWIKGTGKYIESFCQQNIALINEKEIDSKKFLEFMSQDTLDDQLETIRVLSLTSHDKDPVNLMFSAMSGNAQVLDLLLKAGYDLYQPLSSSKYFTQIFSSPQQLPMLDFICPSLIAACISGHLEVFQLLIKAIGDPNVQQKNGETLLMIASYCGHLNIVQTLLENGADPNICDNNGNNALHHALLSETSGKGSPETTLLLLKTVNLNIANKRGRTALMYACRNGHREVVEHLLKTNDINVSLTDNEGLTALCYAAYGRHNEVINVLLSNYDYNQEEIARALTAACYVGHKEMIKVLGDKVNLTEYQKDIITACISDDLGFVASSSMNLPLIESTGLTPLMLAASCGSDGVVQVLLLIAGADVNKQDNYQQYSPLLYAVSGSKSVAIVQYLLDCDADVNVINSVKRTPLDIARHKKLKDIAKLLEDKGGQTYSSIMNVTVEAPMSTIQKAKVVQDTLTMSITAPLLLTPPPLSASPSLNCCII